MKANRNRPTRSDDVRWPLHHSVILLRRLCGLASLE